jgi:hypothetical protein
VVEMADLYWLQLKARGKRVQAARPKENYNFEDEVRSHSIMYFLSFNHC